VLEVVEGDTGNWLHVLHRQKSGQDVFLVCNQNLEGAARAFKFRTEMPGTPECWDAMRNEFSSVPFKRDGKKVEFSLTLEPSESVLLVFQKTDRKLPQCITAGMKPKREFPLRDARPEADKAPPAKLVVVKATYGVPGDATRSRDVRERLQQRIDAGGRSLLVRRLADGDDPASGVVKTLEAECSAGDKRITLKGTDTQIISLVANPSARELDAFRDSGGRPFNPSPVTANPFIGACTIPADLDLANSRVFLETDDLTPEAAASITVNGKQVGGFIGKPFRLDVAKHLKPGNNSIEIVPFAPKAARLVVY